MTTLNSSFASLFQDHEVNIYMHGCNNNSISIIIMNIVQTQGRIK